MSDPVRVLVVGGGSLSAATMLAQAMQPRIPLVLDIETRSNPFDDFSHAWHRNTVAALDLSESMRRFAAMDWARRYPRPSRGYARHVRRMKQTERRI